MDPLIIAGIKLGSRLIAGTSGYPNHRVMLDALDASGAEIATASIRRISLEGYAEGTFNLAAGPLAEAHRGG
jgi:thiazole synthase